MTINDRDLFQLAVDMLRAQGAPQFANEREKREATVDLACKLRKSEKEKRNRSKTKER